MQLAGPLQPGQRVDNYILKDKVGQGTFGEVWKAVHHERPGRVVAIKVATYPEYARQLRREARLPQIEHANIVPVLDSDTRADPPYLVMPFYAGGSLADLIKHHPTGLPEEQVEQILRDILSGLGAAHQRGIVHRDIKPGNVLLDADGRALLSDFGLLRLDDSATAPASMLQSASLEMDRQTTAGTPVYMAPEVLQGAAATAASDVYSVGVTLFEMLTGRLPQGIEWPSRVRAGLSPRPSWDDLFGRACGPVGARPRDAEDMAHALPNDAQAYYDRADWYRDNGKYDRAIADYSEAIRLKPDFLEAYYYRAVAYYYSFNRDRAISDFTEVIRLEPCHIRAYHNRGLAYVFGKGDYDRAIADFTEAIRLDPDYADAYFDRAQLYRNKRDHDRAIADYGEAIRLRPNYANAYYYRGAAYAERGDRRPAIADFRKAAELDPDGYNGQTAMRRLAELGVTNP